MSSHGGIDLEYDAAADDAVLRLTVYDLFAIQTGMAPESVAVVDRWRRLTYADLDRRVAVLSNLLWARGVRRETLVGVFLPRNADLIATLLAILRLGAAYVPLDPQYPAERTRFILEDSGVQVVVADDESAANLPFPDSQTVRLPSTDKKFAEHETEIQASATDLAYILYTSGSTGVPNGVEVAHRGVSALIDWARSTYNDSSGARVLFSTSICFDISVFEIFYPLAVGGTVYIVENLLELPLSGHASEVALVNTVPSAMRALLETSGLPPHVHTVNLAGEALSRHLADLVYAAPHVRKVVNLYGPTEDTVYSTWAVVPRESRQAPTIGRPLPGTRVKVVDGDGAAVSDGTTGELLLAGAGLSRGYRRRPSIDAERFMVDDQGVRWFRTRDLVHIGADGDLVFHGRLDHQVKINGIRIELGEVEARLASRPDVKDAAVIAQEDGNGEKALVAYVVPRAGVAADQGEEAVRQMWDARFDSGERQGAYVDFSDWRSSYDDELLPQEEMEEWRRLTAARIRELPCGRILEIGIGSGAFMAKLAAASTEYWGTDISSTAIQRLKEFTAVDDVLRERVKLFVAAAHETTHLPPGHFDTVVLNSVVQYFPSETYLRETLKAALRLVAPGGAVFVGDVRNLRLQRAFVASVLQARAEAGSADAAAQSIALSQASVNRAVAEDPELLVAPEFFRRFGIEVDAIQGVDVRVKSGRYVNELSKYRYDVVLHTGCDITDLSDARIVHWHVDVESVEGFEPYLRDADTLRVVGIPNTRLQGDFRTLAGIPGERDRNGAPTSAAVALHPDDISNWATVRGYRSVVTWNADSESLLDAVIWRPRTENDRPVGQFIGGRQAITGSTAANVSTPVGLIDSTDWPVLLREELSAVLPAYMVPSHIVPLAELPLTPNGKLDRVALPAPRRKRPNTRAQAVLPSSELESLFVDLWREVLGVDVVGVLDRFFDLGGNSLMLLRVRALARLRAGVDVPAAEMFGAANIRELVARLAAAGEPDGTPGDGGTSKRVQRADRSRSRRAARRGPH